MERLLKYKITGGPYGDAMSAYDVTVLNEESTIGDMIDYIVNGGDWGNIHVRREEGFLNVLFTLEYRNGKVLKDEIPDNIKELQPIRITAHGGYSRMDYEVYIA